jgi:hypothetical protein
VTGYYALFLWLNPDDKGRKDFYSATTVTQGFYIVFFIFEKFNFLSIVFVKALI